MLYLSAFRCIYLHFSAFLYISLHFSTFLCISLYFSAFLYISLHFSTFLCISLNVSAFRCISLHFSTFHFKRNLFHMKSSVGIYTLVLWFRIFLSESKAFLYLLGLRGPLWLEEILHKRIFSWDAHLESKYMSQKRI